MKESIGRLSNTLINVKFTAFYDNLCFMSKIYFGCGIMDMTDAEGKELRRMYEKPLREK